MCFPREMPRFYGTVHDVFAVSIHEPSALTHLPEALVQDLWRTQRFERVGLQTVQGEAVEVLDVGTQNTDAGPDFRGARLRIGGIEWGGDVEVHVTSGTWFDHRHHLDPAYNDTVLHVTFYADVWTGHLRREDGVGLPEVVLYPHLDAPLRGLLYAYYTRARGGIACEGLWPQVPAAVRMDWITTMADERKLHRKAALGQRVLQGERLEALLHERLFAGLGYAKNTAPMAELARRLPRGKIRGVHDPDDLEALHLGTAGLLPLPADLLEADRATADKVMDFWARFDRLRHQLDITPMTRQSWTFFRLRPANFPTLRIVQGAAWWRAGGLLHDHPLHRLRTMVTVQDKGQDVAACLLTALEAVPLAFWHWHVRPDRRTRHRNPALGRSRREKLLINAIAPVLWVLADQEEDPALEQAVQTMFQHLEADHDEVTRHFEALGTQPRNAWQAQGLHQLYRTHCTEGRCLSCGIGQHILGRTKD